MSNKPSDSGKTPDDKNKKPGVKGETYSKVPDEESANVKGGIISPKPIFGGPILRQKSLDPTDTSGCCDK